MQISGRIMTRSMVIILSDVRTLMYTHTHTHTYEHKKHIDFR